MMPIETLLSYVVALAIAAFSGYRIIRGLVAGEITGTLYHKGPISRAAEPVAFYRMVGFYSIFVAIGMGMIALLAYQLSILL